MKPLPSYLSTHCSPWLLCLACSLPLGAQAAATSFFVPYGGEGNVSIFNAAAGTGGWVGSVDQSPDPGVVTPLAFVSVVLFNLNSASKTLSGSFELSTTDLASTLFGQLTGSYFEPDILASGGQFSIDYQILGGSGAFAGASGFGLSFVDYNPAGTFNNYAEAGLLNFDIPSAVPEPASWALLMLGLGLVAASRRAVATPDVAKPGAR